MMYGWLSSNNRKRHQRAMNQIVRMINQNVQNDDLWQGRFYVRQIDARWCPYEDKSGAELFVILQFTDKKTGIAKTYGGSVNHWRYFNGSQLWWAMNNFIVQDVDVWSENPKPNTVEWFNNINWERV